MEWQNIAHHTTCVRCHMRFISTVLTSGPLVCLHTRVPSLARYVRVSSLDVLYVRLQLAMMRAVTALYAAVAGEVGTSCVCGNKGQTDSGIQHQQTTTLFTSCAHEHMSYGNLNSGQNLARFTT